MAGKKGLKKQVWSDDAKRTICAQTLTPGVSVVQIAHRYSMNANLIFKWLKDPRFSSVESGPSPEESMALEGVFLPVEIEASALEGPTAPVRLNDVAADPGPAVFFGAARGHRTVGRATHSGGRPDVAGICHGLGAWVDDMIPVPSNTRVWLAAGVTDRPRTRSRHTALTF
jgi:transposase